MTFAICISFCSTILYALSNIMDSHASNHVFKHNVSLIFYLGITNTLVIPFLLLFGGSEIFILPKTVFIYVLIAAVFEVLYLVPYYAALKRMDTSVICALFSLGRVFLPLLAWLIVDERLCVWQYVGFFLIVLANMILNFKKTDKIKMDKSFYLMALCSFMTVVQSVCAKKALIEMNWLAFSFYLIVLSDVLILTTLICQKTRRIILSEYLSFKKHYKALLLLEAFDRGGALTSTWGLALLPIVVKSAISSTQPIFVFAIGAILYYLFGINAKESLSKYQIIKKLTCFAVIILGVVLAVSE